MELIKNFDFITVTEEIAAKKQTLKQIAAGMRAAVPAGKGGFKTRPAKCFLQEP
jgi:hypothetical protein